MNVSEIIAGDSLQFTTSVPDYPATGGYALTYRLVPRVAGSAIEIPTTASGDGYAVSVAAATTATWAAGEYSWHAYVTLGAARYTVGSGQVTIKANPATLSAGTDTRTDAQKAVADLKAALKAWDPLRKTYTVGDVSMTFNSTADILKMLSYWERELAREDAAAASAAGRRPSRRVFMRSARG